MQIMTTDDDEEIRQLLEMLLKVSRLGLIHESVNVNAPGQYTSTYFLPLSLPSLNLLHYRGMWVDRPQEAGSHGQMQSMRK